MDTHQSLRTEMTPKCSEFSRVIEIKETLLDRKFETKANSDELVALAERFDVHKIENLTLDYFVTEKQDILGAYTLIASIKSKVIKFIVEDREESMEINEKFDVVLLNEDMARNNFEELREFDIEVFNEDKRVDVGEIASQYLSLCIFM